MLVRSGPNTRRDWSSLSKEEEVNFCTFLKTSLLVMYLQFIENITDSYCKKFIEGSLQSCVLPRTINYNKGKTYDFIFLTIYRLMSLSGMIPSSVLRAFTTQNNLAYNHRCVCRVKLTKRAVEVKKKSDFYFSFSVYDQKLHYTYSPY